MLDQIVSVAWSVAASHGTISPLNQRNAGWTRVVIYSSIDPCTPDSGRLAALPVALRERHVDQGRPAGLQRLTQRIPQLCDALRPHPTGSERAGQRRVVGRDEVGRHVLPGEAVLLVALDRR